VDLRRRRGHDRERPLDRRGVQQVVRVEEDDDVTAALREPPLHRGGVTAIGLLDEADAVPVLPQELERAVRRAVVDHDDLGPRVALRQRAVDGRADVVPVVVAGDADGDGDGGCRDRHDAVRTPDAARHDA
jgi:hypothetical protein